MKNPYVNYVILIIAVVLIGIWVSFYPAKQSSAPTTVMSFDDCLKAEYPVTGIHPRQCKTPDGRIYAEDLSGKITYNNASADLITVELPFPEAVTAKDFSVIGQARGGWFFEASFPIIVLDKDGKTLATGVAKALDNWMTNDFVFFQGDIHIPKTYTGKATLILKKDNPSGIPSKDASISFPIHIAY